MTNTDKLTTPWLYVVLDDYTTHTLRVLNCDLVAFDRERGMRPNWPAQGTSFWQTFLAWHILQRTNAIDKCTFGEFETRALQVEGKEPSEVDADEADPTRPARAAG